ILLELILRNPQDLESYEWADNSLSHDGAAGSIQPTRTRIPEIEVQHPAVRRVYHGEEGTPSQHRSCTAGPHVQPVAFRWKATNIGDYITPAERGYDCRDRRRELDSRIAWVGEEG